MRYRSLTVAEIRRASKLLKGEGKALPKVGFVVRFNDGMEIVHDSRGYFLMRQDVECPYCVVSKVGYCDYHEER